MHFLPSTAADSTTQPAGTRMSTPMSAMATLPLRNPADSGEIQQTGRQEANAYEQGKERFVCSVFTTMYLPGPATPPRLS